MLIKNIEQGSTEWLEFRTNKLGASDLASYMAIKNIIKPYYKVTKTIAELLYNKYYNINISNYFMERGRQYENILREQYNNAVGINYEPAVGILEKDNRIIASFDGYHQENGIIEIKVTFSDIKKEIDIINTYLPQLAQQMQVAGTNTNTLIIFFTKINQIYIYYVNKINDTYYVSYKKNNKMSVITQWKMSDEELYNNQLAYILLLEEYAKFNKKEII